MSILDLGSSTCIVHWSREDVSSMRSLPNAALLPTIDSPLAWLALG